MKKAYKLLQEGFPDYFKEKEKWKAKMSMIIEEKNTGNYDLEERMQIERMLIKETSYYESMRDNFEKGLKEGREEGREEGRKEGREEGILYVIQKLLQEQAMPPEQIASIYNLPLARIEQIKKELEKTKNSFSDF